MCYISERRALLDVITWVSTLRKHTSSSCGRFEEKIGEISRISFLFLCYLFWECSQFQVEVSDAYRKSTLAHFHYSHAVVTPALSQIVL